MNRLKDETSPYLLQHADNPVNWFPYTLEAFKIAKKENKLIFLSIGYSACHWCHVMAHESFQNNQIAQILNNNFISIKVDREERPDIDNIYQTMIQIMGKSGGWPLSFFLTPDGDPIFAGTYFPIKKRYGMITFPELLQRIILVFEENKEEIMKSGTQIVEIVQKLFNNESDSDIEEISKFEVPEITRTILHEISQKLNTLFDRKNGGFGSAPKFPNFPAYLYLIRYIAEEIHFKTEKTQFDYDLMSNLQTTLYKIADGGIYDHIGGGFHRYSVDDHWLIPHFEKMLYDNAMALRTYSEAYAVFNDPLYKIRVKEIINWLIREMYDNKHGFYATLDADSEGKEGIYYTWKKKELDQILTAKEKELFYENYNILEQGNFEDQQNILERKKAVDFESNTANIELNLEQIRQKLLSIRRNRDYPHRDEKIITSWNALVVQGLIAAYKIFALDNFGQKILNLIQKTSMFLRKQMFDHESHILYRIYKNQQRKIMGSLDDYAYLIQMLLEEYNISQDPEIWSDLKKLLASVEEKFWDSEHDQFYFSSKEVKDIPVRPQNTYDMPMPNPLSVLYEIYIRLFYLEGEETYAQKADKIQKKLYKPGLAQSSGHATYFLSLQWYLYGSSDITCQSNRFTYNYLVSKYYIPRLHYFRGIPDENTPIIYRNKPEELNPQQFYLCNHFECFKPAKYEKEIDILLKKNFIFHDRPHHSTCDEEKINPTY